MDRAGSRERKGFQMSQETIERLQARVNQLEQRVSQLEKEIQQLKKSSVMLLKPPLVEYNIPQRRARVSEVSRQQK